MPTKLTVPDTVAVTATPASVAFSPAGSSVYTLRNDDADDSIFYIHDSETYPGANIAAFVGASQAAFKDLGASEIRAGESVVIDNMPPSIIVACITDKTATLNVEAGHVVSPANIEANLGNVGLLNAAETEINPATIEMQSGTVGSAMTSVAVNHAVGGPTAAIVNEVAGVEIWVYGYELHANVAGTVQFLDDTPTAKTGVMPVGANGGVAVMSPYPIFKCGAAKDLDITTGTCEVDGLIQYRLVTV